MSGSEGAAWAVGSLATKRPGGGGELCAGPRRAEGRGACWGMRRSCGLRTAPELARETVPRWPVEPASLWPHFLASFKTAQTLTEVGFSLGGKCEV